MLIRLHIIQANMIRDSYRYSSFTLMAVVASYVDGCTTANTSTIKTYPV